MTSRFADGQARWALVLCALGACLAPRASSASEEVDEAAARVLFAEGRKLVADGDYAAACPKFQESFHLDPGIGTGFNLADCWEHIGRTASAWGRFLGVAAAAKALGQTDRERVARERATALEPLLSRLTITVPSPDPGLVVKRDEIPLGPASWGVAVPVDPGPHVVQATAPGRRPFSIEVTVVPSGGTEAVTISPLVVEPASLDAAPPPGIVAIALPAPAAQRSMVPVIVTGAVGVVALTAAGIFGLQFQSANDEAKNLCPTNVCTQSEKDKHDELVIDARRDRNLAYVGVAVGSVALVTAALLWWRPGLLTPASHAAAFHLSPRLAASGGGAVAGVEARW